MRVTQAHSTKSEADRLFWLGYEHYNNGQLTDALQNWQRASSLYRDIGDLASLASTIGNLGILYTDLHDYEQAIKLQNEQLAIARQINSPEAEASALLSLGIVQQLLGNYRQAINHFQDSLSIAQAIDDVSKEFHSLNNLGVVYVALGQYEQALTLYEQALAISQRTGDHRGIGQMFRNLGVAYSGLGQEEQSIELHLEALAIARSRNDANGEGVSLGNMAASHVRLGQYDEALTLYQQRLILARSSADIRGEANSLGGLGDIYRQQGDYQQAIAFYEQELALNREVGDLNVESSALENLGIAYLASGEPELAIESLTAASTVTESLRDSNLSDIDKIALFETLISGYEFLQRAYIAQPNYELAFEVAELSKARALAELVIQSENASTIAITSAQSPDLSAIQSLSQTERKTLVTYSLVPADEGFGAVLYIWLVSPQGEIIFRQQPLTDINLSDLVIDTRNAIGVRGTDRNAPVPTYSPEQLAQLQAEQDEKLSQLHDLLIDPIADLLPDDPNQPVVFIPQDELFLVPFPALKDDNGDYLIENHTILTAPSIQVLQLTHDIADSRNGATTDQPVIVGNPTMPTVTFLTDDGEFVDTQLTPLYGALQEANAVSEFLGTSALTGDQATESTVKQQLASADLIHLATHGLLEYGDPRETGTRDVPGAIALTPGNGEDGLLTAAEILQMDLQADLVVLSACDTGRGRITGDGVIGLSRSFIAAGVPSVVVSLWAVPDAPTADLMTEFYRQLDEGQTKAQALRQAMLITMQDHPDPKDWAAFTLIGESE
ncbi:MAG: CHAT domain-containing tetratricopeptide repeat protein [Cyanobacteria bacterium P01_A01_bin.123]